MEGVLLVVLVHAVQQNLTGLADAAAEDDDLGVGDAGDVGQEPAQQLEDLLQNGLGGLVALAGCGEDVLALVIGAPF